MGILITRVCWLVGWLVGSFVRLSGGWFVNREARCNFSKSTSQICVKFLAQMFSTVLNFTVDDFGGQGQSRRTGDLQSSIARLWFKISSPNLAFHQILSYQK